MEARGTRRRWMRRLLVLAIPAAALPVTMAVPASADHVGCVEVSTTPTTCGTGDPVGVAICGTDEAYDKPDQNIDPSIEDGTATVSINPNNSDTAGVDADARDFGGTSPQGHVVVYAGDTHAGIGSTTDAPTTPVDCP